MSANLLVDLGNTCQIGATIVGNLQSGGPPAPCSGAVIGLTVDMIQADTWCNVLVAGAMSSGLLRVQVQCADADVSGQFTDPTSGIPVGALPGAFQSGGLLWVNSGGLFNGTLAEAFASGASGAPTKVSVASGFGCAQGFIRTGRFVRANLLSGDFGCASVFLVSQLKVTGSGGGFTYSPGSGVVNV